MPNSVFIFAYVNKDEVEKVTRPLNEYKVL